MPLPRLPWEDDSREGPPLCCSGLAGASGSVNRASLFSSAEIIDDLANLVENTDERLRTETRRVTLVDRKSTSCGE